MCMCVCERGPQDENWHNVLDVQVVCVSAAAHCVESPPAITSAAAQWTSTQCEKLIYVRSMENTTRIKNTTRQSLTHAARWSQCVTRAFTHPRCTLKSMHHSRNSLTHAAKPGSPVGIIKLIINTSVWFATPPAGGLISVAPMRPVYASALPTVFWAVSAAMYDGFGMNGKLAF